MLLFAAIFEVYGGTAGAAVWLMLRIHVDFLVSEDWQLSFRNKKIVLLFTNNEVLQNLKIVKQLLKTASSMPNTNQILVK